jgi:hypothetical protein
MFALISSILRLSRGFSGYVVGNGWFVPADPLVPGLLSTPTEEHAPAIFLRPGGRVRGASRLRLQRCKRPTYYSRSLGCSHPPCCLRSVCEEPRANGVDEGEAVVHQHVLFFSSAIFWTQQRLGCLTT